MTTLRPRPLWPALAGLVLALALALAAGSSEQPAAQAPPPPPVSVAQPVEKPAADARRYTGRLQAAERVEVEKGAPLYEIDPRVFQAEVDRAKGEVARLEAEYAAAGRDAERARIARSAVSAEELDRRAASRAVATAALARGKARPESALLDLSFTRVTAPIGGRVGRTRVTAGNLVGQGEPTLLTTIVRTDPLHLVFEVTERDLLTFGGALGRPAPGRPQAARGTVRFGLDTDEAPARRTAVDFRETEVDPSTGTVLVRAVVPNPDGALSPGLFARVEVTVPRGGVLPHVPEAAVGTDQQGRYVFVVAGGKAQRRGITVGPASGGLVAVESGLTASDRVVVAGQVKVRPGTPVSSEDIALDPVLVADGGAK